MYIDDPEILEYLGLAKIRLKFRIKLARAYKRVEWLKDYKSTGRSKPYDKERFKIRQRFNKSRKNLERGSRNEWLLKTWAEELSEADIISKEYEDEIYEDLKYPVTYMERQDHRDELKRIARKNRFSLSNNNDWMISATRKSLVKSQRSLRRF